MQQGFYASGFLYHPPTQQILLQQQKESSRTPSFWQLFGGVQFGQQSAEKTFRHFVQKSLGTKLNLAKIYPVYSYPCKKGLCKNHYLLYAEIKSLRKFPSKAGRYFAWFTFKQVQKLPMDNQTKHDIVISQRVIDSHLRKRLGQKTLE